ncbi:MAG: ferritin-like domain-containing protein [Alphaproteobacteria bacterium]|nr:ferritin-like domain-containing protein [Alphaproteobacteria bacterium]
MDIQPQTIKTLTYLAHLDIDASQAYQQIISHITSTAICNTLTDCLRDHEHRFKDACRMIDKLGGHPPRNNLDFRGYIVQGYITVMNLINKQKILEAIRKNEILNIRSYEKALTNNLVPEARRLIEKGLKDELRHLAYINEALTL